MSELNEIKKKLQELQDLTALHKIDIKAPEYHILRRPYDTFFELKRKSGLKNDVLLGDILKEEKKFLKLIKKFNSVGGFFW